MDRACRSIPGMIPRTVAALTVITLLVSGCGDPGDEGAEDNPGSAAEPLLVLASSGTIRVMEELVALWEADSGTPVRVVHGSTAALSQQVRSGAPADLVMLAEAGPLDELIRDGLVAPESRTVLARGRLALVVPPGQTLPEALDGLRDPRFRLVAIGNPEHAPFGAAARELLDARGLLDELAPRLLFGESVSHALQFVASGNADAGLVAAGLVRGGTGAALPSREFDAAPDRLLHVAGRVHTTRNGDAAQALLRFLASDRARAVFRDGGFAVPDTASGS